MKVSDFLCEQLCKVRLKFFMELNLTCYLGIKCSTNVFHSRDIRLILARLCARQKVGSILGLALAARAGGHQWDTWTPMDTLDTHWTPRWTPRTPWDTWTQSECPYSSPLESICFRSRPVSSRLDVFLTETSIDILMSASFF